MQARFQTGDMIAFITYSMVIVMSFLMIGMIAIMLPRAMLPLVALTRFWKRKVLLQTPFSRKRANSIRARKALLSSSIMSPLLQQGQQSRSGKH